jgi:hypothetical protein
MMENLPLPTAVYRELVDLAAAEGDPGGMGRRTGYGEEEKTRRPLTPEEREGG